MEKEQYYMVQYIYKALDSIHNQDYNSNFMDTNMHNWYN